MTPQQKKNNDINTCTQRYACLVNRTIVIDTLEKKANLTNYEYIRRPDINTDFIEKRDRKGNFLYYEQTIPVEIVDVDGKIKKTVKTSYYQQNKVTPYLKKPAFGVHTKYLASRYHGTKSCNWKQEYLTLQEISNTLNSGYAIAPGEFQPPKDESIRSSEYCMSRQFILFDADEWTAEHPAPVDISELIKQYPDIQNDFYWIGESISSRSSLKPELRCRLMLVLPQPIKKGEDKLWETVIDNIVDKYPFIARGPGIDQVRASFGNARPDCENRNLNGIISQESFETWKSIAADNAEQIEKEKQEIAEQKARQVKARQRNQKTRDELKKRGHKLTDRPTDPFMEFCKADPATLLTNHGIATHLQGNEWNYTGSSAGRSFILENEVIKPFSNSAQAASPAGDPTKPVNAHRYIAYILYNLDMTKPEHKRQLRCELSNTGYGTHPDNYDKYRKEFESLARKEGLLKPRTAEQRLSIDKKHQTESESINVLRLQNDKRFQDWITRTQDTDETHILIIGTGAGTGKTTLTILKLDKSVDVSPITELADDKFDKAIEKGKNAVRHRPRHYNQEAGVGNNPYTQTIGLYGGETVPCVFPDHCNALAQRGYNPITTFCNRCHRKDECDEQGYLSQYRTLQEYEQIYFAWNEGLLTDPISRKYIQKLTENGDYVGVLDEVDPADLCPQRSYTNKLLIDIYNEYRDVDCETAPFLRKFIRETSTASTPKAWTDSVRKVLSDFTDETLQDIDNELQRIPVTIKFSKAVNPPKNLENRPTYKDIAHITYKNKTIACAILTDPDDAEFLDNNKWILNTECMPKTIKNNTEYPILISVNTFIRLGFVSLQTPESISLLPRRLYKFTADLKSYVDSVESDTPPAQCHPEGWEFYLTPALNMRRVVFISASGVIEMINELYKHTEIDIEIIDGKPPEWKQGCKLYQLSTGRYTPSQSLIEKDENRQPITLKPRAIEMLSIIEKVANASPDKKVLVVAPNAFTPSGALADQQELKRIHKLPNVDIINHAHAEGVNTYEHHEISFIFGHEIPPPDLESIARRIYRKDTLSFEREKTNITKDSATLKDVERYTDPRVQKVHNKTCESVLMQAITRQRQMLHENRTCYLLTSEPISGLPTTSILTTLPNMFLCLERDSNLDNLDAFLAEQTERSVAEIAERENITERGAYKRTSEKRKNERDESEQKILQEYDPKISFRNNAEKLGISLGKLQSILKKHKQN